MQQIVRPDLSVTEYAGLCLKMARRIYRAPAIWPSAWEAWLKAPGRHSGKHPTNVSVPVWFSHYGTYGSPPKYANWGHVVAFVPGKGYLSSPGSGHGQRWFRTIAAVERFFKAKYVGWSEGINGVRVVAPVAKPRKVRKVPNMIILRCVDALGKGKRAWAIIGPVYRVTADKAEVVRIKAQNGITVDSLTVSKKVWDEYAAAAGVLK